MANNKVFASAEDCNIIAPYIPPEMLKNWEWWYSRSGKLAVRPENGTQNYIHIISESFQEDFPSKYQTPALDTGILGKLLACCNSQKGEFYYKRFGGPSELQSRVLAIKFLIREGQLLKENSNDK